ncbi:helix-turn-helix transcriptional regulator [Alkalicoccus chagannorensis]|uniref:helix-turn-helix transcriptional regulator n=1 Tax=Alkalicoccus chagannorensis TaxID=427072 RepID=UPI00047E3DEF|nr:AraC family transcriptional regulator [Alkalicoccus chagannorensis]
MVICSTAPPLPVYVKGGRGRFAAGRQHFSRKFHLFDMLFVLQGELAMMEDNQEIRIPEGHYYILLPGRHHNGSRPCAEETIFFWCHFYFIPVWWTASEKPDWAARLRRKADHHQPDEIMLSIPQQGEVQEAARLRQMFEELFSTSDSVSPSTRLKQQTRFMDILLFLQQERDEKKTGAQQAADLLADYIHTHFADADFTLKQAASALMYHPDYLSRALRNRLGMSPVEYLHTCRLEKAKQQLEQTNEHHQAIAEACGYKDASYFSKIFKKREGVSPASYRRMSIRNE